MKLFAALLTACVIPVESLAQTAAPPPTPADVKPGSITCEDVPYPYPVSYLPLTLYGQDIRLAYMDVPAQGQPNGHTVVLFHGMNFAGFYWGGPIDALRKEGFRVVVPDQIGFGRSSKPIIPYNFHDMARNTQPAAAAPEDRQSRDRRPLDGRHAGSAVRDAISRRGRARRHLQPDRRARCALRTSVGKHRRSVQANAGDDLPADSRGYLPVFFAQSGGVEAGVRQISEDPVRLDAQRRLAAIRDGAGAAAAGDLSGPGRQRLGKYQSADAGVRRRRRQSGRALPACSRTA